LYVILVFVVNHSSQQAPEIYQWRPLLCVRKRAREREREKEGGGERLKHIKKK